MCFGGGSDAAGQAAALQAQQQAGVTQGLADINQAFAGFTPEFYQQRAQDYTNAALPAFQQQYKQNLGSLIYGLGNQGLIGSSAAKNKANNFNNYANQQQLNIANQGLAAAQNLESNVNQNKSQLISQLEASYNPTATAQQALASASQFSAPSPAPAIGNLFSDWINIYGTGQANNIANQALANSYLKSGGGDSLGSSQNIVK